MNRRQILMAGLTTAIPTIVSAQDNNKPSSQDYNYYNQIAYNGLVNGAEELWYLLTAMETLIFLIATEVEKDPKSIMKTQLDFRKYRAQLIDENAPALINAALQSRDATARIKVDIEQISLAGERVVSLLSDVVISGVLRTTLSRSFVRTSTLLDARSAENKGWWCHCWGLRMINC